MATTKDITTINGYSNLAAGAHTIQVAATDNTGIHTDSTKTSYTFYKLVTPTRESGSTLLDDTFSFGTVSYSAGYVVYATNNGVDVLLGVVQPVSLVLNEPASYTIDKDYADITSGVSATDTITLTPASGYRLPSTVSVTGATSSYNSTTGVITLSSIAGAVTITVTAVVDSHTLTNSITNMTVSGTTVFNDGGSGTTNVSCGSAYGLPLTITINGTAVAAGATVSTANFGCTYTMTNDRAGTLAFTGVKANLTLTGTVRATLNAPTIAFAPAACGTPTISRSGDTLTIASEDTNTETYTIYYAASGSSSYATLGTASRSGNSTTVVLTALANYSSMTGGTTYSIKVIASGTGYGDSADSNVLTFTKFAAPTSPSISGDTYSFTGVSGATSYDIYADNTLLDTVTPS